jgi:endonuclease/exonuclease/phosphatase family metal-dependent hydrolase
MKNVTLKLMAWLLVISMLTALPLYLVSCNNSGSTQTEAPQTDETTAIPEDTEALLPSILIADLEKYAVVRPEKLTDYLKSEIVSFYQRMNKEYNITVFKDDFYRDDIPAYKIGEYEILVGKTNRPETADFLSKLKYNDFGYAQYGNKIVIAGHSDESTANAIREFIFSVIQNKDAEDGVFYKESYNYLKAIEYRIKELTIENNDISEYRIVYPKRNSGTEQVAAQLIADAVAKASGIVIKVMHDGEAEASGREILIGATNRNTEAEIAEFNSKITGLEAIVAFDGNNVNIYGLSPTAILVAANGLISGFVDQKADKYSINLEASQIFEYNDSLLKAMSFNVWVGGKTTERNERVLNMCLKYLPDTIGFQEVDPVWLATLNAGLRDQYAFVGEGRNGGASGEYNPIFYKKEVFNLIESGTRWLSDTPNKVSKVDESSLNRIYTFALLERKSDGKRIMVVNTHFDHTSAQAREKQAKVLVEYLKTITEYPIVLTGDFNCESSSSAYSTLVSTGIANSSDIADKKINNVATFTNYGSSNKIIDFVFVSSKLIGVTSYQVCNEKINGDFPSDHHPVLIEYTLLG